MNQYLDNRIQINVEYQAVMHVQNFLLLMHLRFEYVDINVVFYIRLSRKKAEQIYMSGSTFEIGKANTLREGSDATIIASGICVADACRVADKLADEGIHVRVLDMFTIKPIDKEAIIKASKETGAIVTVENHNIMNGLGSAVSEVLSEEAPCRMKRLGAPDCFGEVGTVPFLKEKYHMAEKDIEEAVKSLVSKKDVA